MSYLHSESFCGLISPYKDHLGAVQNSIIAFKMCQRGFFIFLLFSWLFPINNV